MSNLFVLFVKAAVFIVIFLFKTPIFLISLSVHEFSHGFAAYFLGDDTAKRAGRLTLNPVAHIDIFGLIMLFIAHFGWAKPVPINPYNFRDFKRDTAITAAAGPISNFLIAILFAVILKIYTNFNPEVLFGTGSSLLVFILLLFTVFINLALGIFNLLPIPPMDGSKILGGFLSDAAYAKYTAKEHQGMRILMLVFLISFVFRINIIGPIILPPIDLLTNLLTGYDSNVLFNGVDILIKQFTYYFVNLIT